MKRYTIGEVAKMYGIAPSALRYYDKEGLLPFIERTGGGARLFKEEDLEWLTTIECLKDTGMPIKMIKQFIDWCLEGDATIEHRLALIEEHRASVVQQIEQLKEHLDLLEYKRWYYEVAQAAGSCDVHRELTEDKVPERFRARHCACTKAR